MSTAEAVNIAYAAKIGRLLLGRSKFKCWHDCQTVDWRGAQDNPDDAKRMRFYMDNVARERAKQDATWKAFDAGKTFWQ